MSYLGVEDTYQYMPDLPKGDLIEFGVFSGNCLNRLIKGAELANNPFNKVYGFDSFCGLPKEAPFVWQNPEWPEGAFNVCADFNLKGIEEAIQFVQSRIERKNNIELIPGFFEDTLTKELGQKLYDRMSYIHVDVDIYLSTVQVLNWAFKYEIGKIGSLWRFDDWFPSGSNQPEWTMGNSLAFKEVTQQYKLVFARLASNIFILKEYQYG